MPKEQGLVLQPTHKCFDDAMDFVEDAVRKDPTVALGDTLLLVHGICTHNETGDPYSHAWVEDRNIAWDAGLVDGERVYYSMQREDFLRARGVIKATRYTMREVLTENMKSGHYGPWREEYRALCLKKKPT